MTSKGRFPHAARLIGSHAAGFLRRFVPSGNWVTDGFFLPFLVLSVGIGTVGYWYIEHQSAAYRTLAGDGLSAIADMKLQQVLDWRKERLSNAVQTMQNPFLGQHAGVSGDQECAGTWSHPRSAPVSVLGLAQVDPGTQRGIACLVR